MGTGDLRCGYWGANSVSASSMANYAEKILPEIATSPVDDRSDTPMIIHPGITTGVIFVFSCFIDLICGRFTWWLLNRDVKKPTS